MGLGQQICEVDAARAVSASPVAGPQAPGGSPYPGLHSRPQLIPSQSPEEQKADSGSALPGCVTSGRVLPL